jgi:hypothetical protein
MLAHSGQRAVKLSTKSSTKSRALATARVEMVSRDLSRGSVDAQAPGYGPDLRIFVFVEPRSFTCGSLPQSNQSIQSLRFALEELG